MTRCSSKQRSALAELLAPWIPTLLILACALGRVSALPRQGPASSEPYKVLIRNVVLFDPDQEEPDVTVQILLGDGKLELVTQDKVSSKKADLVVNANGGVLMGKLELGQLPNFMILSGDPRQDFEVLLDTSRYAIFAVNEGEVVLNHLQGPPVASEEDDEDEPVTTSWFSYTPPPMSLPSSYRNTNKWNRWDTKYVSGIFLAAIALDRQSWVAQDDVSRTQVGDLDAYNGGEVRALRFGAVGSLNFADPWIYTVFGATHAFDKGFDSRGSDSLSLFDLRLDIPAPSSTTFSVGMQKEPISMERTMGMVYQPMQERSAVGDALLPARNVGAVLSGTGFHDDMSWAAGAFNDWLDSGGSISDGANQFVGRVTWVPLASAGESSLLHLGVGVRYSDAKEGLRFGTEPEFNKAPAFVDTGEFDANSSWTYDLEASWRQGPVWFAGEYIWNDISAPDAGDPRIHGHHLTASWALSGEMREYNRKSGIFMPLPVAHSVDDNGWGAWEAGVRWSTLDANDGSISGGDMDIYSLGLTWWLTPVFNVSANYRWITLDEGLGERGKSNGFAIRILLLLE